MKILITGASGLLGRALMREFASESPVGTAYSRANNGLVKVDLTDVSAVQKLIEDYHPQVIIHAAAERRPDISAQNPEQALALNVAATRQLAEAAKTVGAWVLYISTDYVFDGNHPPYGVDAKPNPINFYGQSKWQGEQALWQKTKRAAVLRVPVLYGQVESWAESAVTALYPLLDAPKAMVDDYAIRYPTLVDDVAKACRVLIQQLQKDTHFSGTFHFSGQEAMTKYQMLQVMAKLSGKSMEHIVAQKMPMDAVPRPADCHLDTSVLEKWGGVKTTSFAVAMTGILSQKQKT